MKRRIVTKRKVITNVDTYTHSFKTFLGLEPMPSKFSREASYVGDMVQFVENIDEKEDEIVIIEYYIVSTTSTSKNSIPQQLRWIVRLIAMKSKTEVCGFDFGAPHRKKSLFP